MWRFLGTLRLILFIIFGTGTILFFLITGVIMGWTVTRAMKIRAWFFGFIPKVMGVRIEEKGKIHRAGPYLIISNHRSYVDAVPVLRNYVAFPVAKAEVSTWPLISWGSNLSGVLYVQRENADSRLATRQSIEAYLREGKSILIYPEGTTSDLDKTLPLRPSTFRIAAQNDIPVIPVAVDFKDKRDAFVRDDTFLPHFIRTFGKFRGHMKIAYGDPVSNSDHVKLITEVEDWINSKLSEFRLEWSRSTDE